MFLDWLFKGGNSIASMPGTVGPNGLVAPTPAPTFNANPEIMFDPTLGKVVAGSLTPGMAVGPNGGPPMPMPKPQMPYGGPDMPPMARGTPSGPSAPPAPPPSPPGAGMSAGNWSAAMAEQPKPQPGAGMSASNWSQASSPLAELVDKELQAYGGPDQPPLARGSAAGIPILDFLRANTPTYRTGGSF